jgi:hypothetical protein
MTLHLSRCWWWCLCHVATSCPLICSNAVSTLTQKNWVSRCEKCCSEDMVILNRLQPVQKRELGVTANVMLYPWLVGWKMKQLRCQLAIPTWSIGTQLPWSYCSRKENSRESASEAVVHYKKHLEILWKQWVRWKCSRCKEQLGTGKVNLWRWQ